MKLSKLPKKVIIKLRNILFDYRLDPNFYFEEHAGEGICLECGSIRGEVEQDASGYECSNCGLFHVVGIETALEFL